MSEIYSIELLGRAYGSIVSWNLCCCVPFAGVEEFSIPEPEITQDLGVAQTRVIVGSIRGFNAVVVD